MATRRPIVQVSGQLQELPTTDKMPTNFATATNVVYVSKEGSDANTGLTPDFPKLTIGAAITVASGLTPSASNRVSVIVMDAGTYAEDVTMVSHVDLIGRSAKLDGTIEIVDNSTIILREVNPSSGSGLNLIRKSGGTGSSYCYIDLIDSRNVTSSRCLRNTSAGSVIFVMCAQMWVGAGNTGVGDQTSGFGHVHLYCPDLYLAGNNAKGIVGNNTNASIIGYIDHILETGSPTGTEAITVGASGVVHLTCTQIIADTAYTITAGGTLNLVCPDVQGVRTGTPTCEISDQLVATVDSWLSGKMRLSEVASPATPPSGTVYVYAKADGKVYRKDDTGTETELGGGGTASLSAYQEASINLYMNGNFR